MKKGITTVAFTVSLVFSLLAQDRYTLIEKSSIKVSGTSTLHDWEVAAQKVAGSLELELKGKSKKNTSPQGKITGGELTVKVADLKGEKGETMNGKMHRALKYDAHPFIAFQLADVYMWAEGQDIKGKLTIAGKTNDITLQADEVVVSDREVKVMARVPLKMTDFGVEPPSAMFGQIQTGDEVEVHLTLYFAADMQ